MKIKSIVISLALSSFLAAPVAMAADNMSAKKKATDTISAEKKKEIEKIVHDYLVKNPEVLMEASQALQQKQQQDMQAAAKEAIVKNAEALFAERKTSTGDPKSDVTLVEFFDYQCGHCKRMEPVIAELAQSNKNLRVIHIEFPIFGESSQIASRAALAAAEQGKYDAFRKKLLQQEGKLTKAKIMELAKSVNLDMPKLDKDMNSKKVTDILDQNRKLAVQMRLMGTPAFVVAATPEGKFDKESEPAFIPGATSKEALQDLIQRSSSSSR